jgi:2-amino-4-hydroxy-6-hydroxymethyldihydropteridine diphosphokinase
MAVIAYIGLGSNLGDREAALRRAVEMLAGMPGTKVLRVSSIYRTQPVGKTDQPEFLNMAAEVGTGLEPRELMAFLRGIEKKLGRMRGERWGPRTIDLDILFYEDRVLREPDLEIPHPRINQRAFVLEPLSELVPDLVDPITGKTVSQILAGLDRRGQRVEKTAELPRPLPRGDKADRSY